MFPDKKEEAFSANRFWFAFGFMAGYLMALVLDFQIHLSIMLAIVIINVVAYTCLIVKTQTRQELLPCCYHVSKEEGAAENSNGNAANHTQWNGKGDFANQQNIGKKCERAQEP